MTETPSPLTLELLSWLSSRPRTYGEAMDAWRSNCPRQSVWDDAVVDGLVRVVRNRDAMSGSTVALTARGKAVLEGE